MNPTDLCRRSSACSTLLALLLCMLTSGQALCKKSTYAYVTYSNGTITQYKVSETGEFVPLANAGVSVPGTKTVLVAVDPTGHFAYLPATEADSSGMFRSTVYQFAVGKDGALAPLNPPSVPSEMGDFQGSAIDRTGRFYYAAINNVYGGIAQYRIEKDGTLSPLKPATIPGGNAPTLIAIHPTKPLLYLANRGDSTITVYRIGKDGTLALLDPDHPEGSVAGGGDMAFSPDGKYLYAADDYRQVLIRYWIEKDGTLTESSTASFEGEVCCGSSRMAVDPADGSVYLIETFSRNLYHFGLDSDGKLEQQPVETYRVTPENKVKTTSEVKASIANKISAMKLKPGSVEVQNAESAAVESITAAPAAITRGPDGAFYVAGSCGVSRFGSKGAVASTSQPVATWPDLLAPRKADRTVSASNKASDANGKGLGYPNSLTIVSRDE